MTERLQNFGYCEAEGRGSFLMRPGEKVRGHEFHYSTWDGEGVSPAFAVRRFRTALRPLIERLDPAVVHAHFSWTGRDFAGACAATGVPLVVTFHGSDATVYPDFRRRERFAPENLLRAHRLVEMFEVVPRAIAVSSFIADIVRARGFTGDVDIIPAGVRLEEFPYRPPRDDAADPRLIFIGRLVPRKGLDVLLRALAGLAPGLHRTTLAVIGDGPSRASLEALTAELGLRDRVTFYGALLRPRIRALLHDSDVLVMSSRTMPTGEAEGSPVVTKEALAVGLPVVATDCGGTRETFPPELAGEVVPEDDPRMLAERLTGTLSDPGDWRRRSELGRRFVEERFSWRDLAEQTLAVYRALATR